ncbi:MAG: arginine deiminase family protein [Cytophagales bacterium]|nr:arginine deiminase family protein [Cytophagales bacterium]
MNLKLNSEFGKLKAVITHRPGKEIERLTPYNTSELLFEDVPYLEGMQQEHDEFRKLIREAVGARVYRLHDLLTEILLDSKLKISIFDRLFSLQGSQGLLEDFLARYSTAECASILIAGIKTKELKKKLNSRFIHDLEDEKYLINPSPNLYFMRDPAAIVQAGVICSHMKFSGRQGESVLLKHIFENHPDFRQSFSPVYPHKTMEPEIPTIEGGDVIVLSQNALAIGCSERTDKRAIELVARQVIKNSGVERVYQVDLPPKRNFMHLDTVFTIIDENLIVTFSEAMNSVLQTCVYRQDDFDEQGEVLLHKECVNESIISVLKKEIPYLEIVETGAGNPDFSSREQWYDGANVFAVSPRRVISYDRNKFTNRALKEAGVEVIETSSSELSRGLGGPRCMTMPLWRMELNNGSC